MKTIGTVCLKIVDVMGKICEYICATLALIITLLVFVQVILRALDMPLFGIEELLTFPTIWIYFLGGACASFTDSHIECGLVGAVAKIRRLSLWQRTLRISAPQVFPFMC